MDVLVSEMHFGYYTSDMYIFLFSKLNITFILLFEYRTSIEREEHRRDSVCEEVAAVFCLLFYQRTKVF